MVLNVTQCRSYRNQAASFADRMFPLFQHFHSSVQHELENFWSYAYVAAILLQNGIIGRSSWPKVDMLGSGTSNIYLTIEYYGTALQVPTLISVTSCEAADQLIV